MPSDPAEPAFLTTREVAELLRVKERKVYDLAASGGIPCRRVTGKLLFPRAEIEAWLAGGTASPAARTAPIASRGTIFAARGAPGRGCSSLRERIVVWVR